MSARRTKSFTAAALLAATAVKTSIATSTSIATYTTTDLNGSSVTANVATASILAGMASYPVAVLSSQASAYTASSTIVWTGTYRGVAATSTGTIVGTGGGISVYGNAPLDTITSIVVAAQAATNGAFTFGWSGVAFTTSISNGVASKLQAFSSIMGLGTGDIVVEYGVGTRDTMPSIASRLHPCSPIGIVTSAADLTAYWPD